MWELESNSPGISKTQVSFDVTSKISDGAGNSINANSELGFNSTEATGDEEIKIDAAAR